MGNLSVSGIVSGFDTQEMINELMELERKPLERLEERRIGHEQEQELLEETKRNLNSLQDKGSNLKDSFERSNMIASSSSEEVLTATADEGAIEEKYNIKVEQLAGKHRVESEQVEGDTLASLVGNGEDFEEALVFENIGILEGEEENIKISVNGDDTLEELRDRINDEGISITASIMDNHLRLTGDETGEDNKIKIENNDTAQNLGFYVEDNENDYELNTLTEAQNAVFTVDGTEVERAHNDGLDDVITGVTIDLHGTTPESSDPVTLDVVFDSESLVENTKSFIEKYNETRDFITENTNVDTHERGMLADNPALRRVNSNMRNILGSQVENNEGQILTLAELGITTTKWNEGEQGHLEFDEGEFRQAIESDLDGAKNVMDNVLGDFNEYLESLTEREGIMNSSIEAVEGNISRVDDRMETMMRRLARTEERLQNDFIAMEQALHRMQEQGGFMEQQTMGMFQE